MATTAPPATTPTTALVANHLFSATVHLGPHLGPIPLLGGGQRMVEPITGGNIAGPAFNAVIEGGFAAPIFVQQQPIPTVEHTPSTQSSTNGDGDASADADSDTPPESEPKNDGESTKQNHHLLAHIWPYGTASDGSAFFLEESGVGGPGGQNTRLNIQVGGRYKALQTMYVLAQPRVVDRERTM
ncbi:uncharacterized protein C8A04DRAFT_26562 [Dichotomopilus funicola]|uniref:Uncharacterized protein n=1 Tax=Dichotomopilus funicola TaxID=1934379 RepID=A0AAN6V6V9_9PEZI|nr:hypothetical protein C8A04DRAFT_26562 [Dichotomopilus funicola]